MSTPDTNRRSWVLSPGQRVELVTRYAAGENSEQLAKEFGLHPAYVRVAGRRAGIFRKPWRIKPTTNTQEASS